MGFRWGQLFLRATSLVIPAARKSNAKSQMFPHFIFFGFCSFCGMRRWLKLVATPLNTISAGKIQGVSKRMYVARAQQSMMIQVMVFFMDTLNAITAAYIRKPTAMEGMNLKI